MHGVSLHVGNMAVTLNSNVSAQRLERLLARNSADLSGTMTRLSSGLRVNRAADDSAGLAVASGLNADARILTQAIRNVNDGISALTIAEGALSELSAITTRQRELAQQAANGVLTSTQRREIDKEANALVDEFNRIVQTTSFNGTKLIEGTSNQLSIQLGTTGSGDVDFLTGQALTHLSETSSATPTTVNSGLVETTTFNFAGAAGSAEVTRLSNTDTAGTGEVTRLQASHGLNDAVDEALLLETVPGQFVAFYFGPGGYQPPGAVAYVEVNVTGVDTGDYPALFARLDTAINSVGGTYGWSSSFNAGEITVTHTNAGDVYDRFEGGNNQFSDDAIMLSDGTSSDFSSGDYFSIFSGSTEYYVWYNLNGQGGNPYITPNGIEVEIDVGDDAGTILTKTRTALNPYFSTAWSGSDLLVTSNVAGPATDSHNHTAGDGGFIVSRETNGALDFRATDRLTFSSPTQAYYLWFSVGGGDPGGVGRSIATSAFTTTDPNWSYTAVAQDAANRINADAVAGTQLLASASNGVLTITNLNAGVSTDGTSNMAARGTVNVTQQGTASSVNTTTDTLSATAHGFTTGMRVRATSTGSVPGGMTANTDYYVISTGANTFKLAATYANAMAGTAIDLTSTGFGTLSIGEPSTAYVNTIEHVDLSSQSGARAALTSLSAQQERIASELGTIGANQNRLFTALSTVRSATENYRAAEQRIIDADVAQESATALRGQILQSLGSSILAQANQAPQLALSLLNPD